MFSFHSLTLLSQKPDQAPEPQQKNSEPEPELTPEPEQTKPKNVRFSEMASGQIIPNRETLEEENLITKLWFQADDYKIIKADARTQVFFCARKHEITTKEAVHKLFRSLLDECDSEEYDSDEYYSEEDSSEDYDSEECDSEEEDEDNQHDAPKIGA